MLSILFWNINGVGLGRSDRRYYRLAQRLRFGVEDRKIDILALAESPFQGSLPLQNFVSAEEYVETAIPGKGTVRLEIYYRKSAVHLGAVTLLDRAMIHTVRVLETETRLSLATAHLKSASNSTEQTRQARARQLASAISNHEDQQGSRFTAVVGDFNFDPWNLAMIGAEGLLAVPTKALALKRERKISVLNASYRFF